MTDGLGSGKIRLDDRVGSGLHARVLCSSWDDCCIASKIPERTELSQSNCMEIDDRVGSGLHARVVRTSSDDCRIASKCREGTKSWSGRVDTEVRTDELCRMNVDEAVSNVVDKNVCVLNCGCNNGLVHETNCKAIDQSWTYTWVLKPQAGDVVVEVVEDPDVLDGVKLVKRKRSGGVLPDSSQVESTLLWTLIELQRSGRSSDGSLQYT